MRLPMQSCLDMQVGIIPFILFLKLQSNLWKLKPEARHTGFVFIDHGSAVFLGILGIAKQHALVACSFLVFAYAAGLFEISYYQDRM